jgi:hypothetical protein
MWHECDYNERIVCTSWNIIPKELQNLTYCTFCVANNGCFFLVKVHFQSLLLLGPFFKKGLLGTFFKNFTKFNPQKFHDLYHTTVTAVYN